jgi:hypothetical protein
MTPQELLAHVEVCERVVEELGQRCQEYADKHTEQLFLLDSRQEWIDQLMEDKRGAAARVGDLEAEAAAGDQFAKGQVVVIRDLEKTVEVLRRNLDERASFLRQCERLGQEGRTYIIESTSLISAPWVVKPCGWL